MVYAIETRVVHAPLPEGFREIEDLISHYESDPKKAEALARARKKLAIASSSKRPKTISDLRLQKGFSQSHLATLIGTSQPRLSLIESGATDMLLTTFEKLATALNVSRDELAQAVAATMKNSK